MSLNLLLVEDDVVLAETLAAELRDLGHRVAMAGEARVALAMVDRDAFDAVILDRMLPGVDGVDMLRKLRERAIMVPVVMLTALGRSIEKVEGLDAGADDYVVKPVDAIELQARIQAVLRGRKWSATAGDATSDTIRAGDIVVSPNQFRATRDGVAIELSKLEFRLLLELARNAGSAMTRTMLLERVWGLDVDPGTNIVDVYIRYLRTKLMRHGGDDPIATVRGVGYRLRE